jgi:hypothetical protein
MVMNIRGPLILEYFDTVLPTPDMLNFVFVLFFQMAEVVHLYHIIFENDHYEAVVTQSLLKTCVKSCKILMYNLFTHNSYLNLHNFKTTL